MTIQLTITGQNKLQNIYEEQFMTNFDITSEDRTLKTHVIIVSQMLFFKRWFEFPGNKDNNTYNFDELREIHHDVDINDMETILKYYYGFDIQIDSIEKLSACIKLSNFLDCQCLLKTLSTYVEKNMEKIFNNNSRLVIDMLPLCDESFKQEFYSLIRILVIKYYRDGGNTKASYFDDIIKKIPFSDIYNIGNTNIILMIMLISQNAPRSEKYDINFRHCSSTFRHLMNYYDINHSFIKFPSNELPKIINHLNNSHDNCFTIHTFMKYFTHIYENNDAIHALHVTHVYKVKTIETKIIGDVIYRVYNKVHSKIKRYYTFVTSFVPLNLTLLSHIGKLKYDSKEKSYNVMINKYGMTISKNEKLVIIENNTGQCYFISVDIIDNDPDRKIIYPYCRAYISFDCKDLLPSADKKLYVFNMRDINCDVDIDESRCYDP